MRYTSSPGFVVSVGMFLLFNNLADMNCAAHSLVVITSGRIVFHKEHLIYNFIST